MGMKAGRHPDLKLHEYMRRYGLTKRQVYMLGGTKRIDAMSEDARQVLANMCKTKKRA